MANFIAPISKEKFLEIKKNLEIQKEQLILLNSNSMAPLLPENSSAVVIPCSFEDVKIFDIIVFWEPEKLTCHLCWGKNNFRSLSNERSLVTRGLNSNSFDFPVPESHILGLVRSHRPSFWQRIRVIFSSWRRA